MEYFWTPTSYVCYSGDRDIFVISNESGILFLPLFFSPISKVFSLRWVESGVDYGDAKALEVEDCG